MARVLPHWNCFVTVSLARTAKNPVFPFAVINVARLIYWEGVILLGGLFGLIVWRLFTGEISLDGLLYGSRRDRSAFFSPGRTQLLMVTILTASYYLLQVIHDPTTFPEIPAAWVVALGGSQAIYLGGKAQSRLPGIRDLIERRTP
jgi:hypothetical protein